MLIGFSYHNLIKTLQNDLNVFRFEWINRLLYFAKLLNTITSLNINVCRFEWIDRLLYFAKLLNTITSLKPYKMI